ncbi:MAG: hypothetical protein ACLVEJ_09475 [Parabacteroides sp.]
MERISSLEEQLRHLEELYNYVWKVNPEPVIFPVTSGRTAHKRRYGSYPGYNIQAGVDATNHMVVSAEVTNHANDWNELCQCRIQHTGNW